MRGLTSSYGEYWRKWRKVGTIVALQCPTGCMLPLFKCSPCVLRTRFNEQVRAVVPLWHTVNTKPWNRLFYCEIWCSIRRTIVMPYSGTHHSVKGPVGSIVNPCLTDELMIRWGRYAASVVISISYGRRASSLDDEVVKKSIEAIAGLSYAST